MTQTTVKKENGARLVKPLLFTVDAQPMGRGTTAPLRSRDYLQFDPAIIEKRPVCRGNHGHEPSDAIQDAICQLLRLCCRSRLNAKGVVAAGQATVAFEHVDNLQAFPLDRGSRSAWMVYTGPGRPSEDSRRSEPIVVLVVLAEYRMSILLRK